MIIPYIQYLYLSDEDVGLLLLYQTQSILSTDFSSEVRIHSFFTFYYCNDT